MFIKILIFISLIINISFANSIQSSGNIYKEKQELIAVKDELNEFYEIKELEYQQNKAQLERIQKVIKKDEQSIKNLRDENQKILDEINRVITSKAMLMYDKMKLGVAINIFNEMIKNGEIDEVFDILTRLKEKRVMKILKKFDTKTSTLLMKKMRIYKEETKK
jgi:flagellar motility protein MotE (MotC chaperone)